MTLHSSPLQPFSPVGEKLRVPVLYSVGQGNHHTMALGSIHNAPGRDETSSLVIPRVITLDAWSLLRNTTSIDLSGFLHYVNRSRSSASGVTLSS